jgi:serine/threonine-protein kinase
MSNVLRNPLVLPEDVLIVPVTALSEEVRNKLGDGGEEFAITRPLAREPSKLLDTAAARLIEQFRQPRTIVQAILSYSQTYEADPERTLEDAVPLLRQMLNSGLLMPEGSEEARRIAVTFAAGTEIGSFRVTRCVQTLDDSELYQARDANGKFVALKIARKEHTDWVQPRWDREVAALRRLDGVASPRLVDHGVIEGRPYLVTEWIAGVDIFTAADLRRPNGREALLKFMIEVARDYVAIHERGVLHGDVHPGNILVGREGTTTLIDFGFAQIHPKSGDTSLRGGVSFYMEPEYACALLEERPPPDVTPLGEQFALGALLYMVATGQHYMDFTLQQEEMFRQIQNAKPLPFSQRGIVPWPELELVLARALAVSPVDRFPDMASFAQALSNVTPPMDAPAIWAPNRSAESLKNTLSYIGLDSSLYRDGLGAGPLCSVNFGTSGIAYALYRIACQRDDPRLLAAADAWIMKAQAEAEGGAAFYNRAIEMTEAMIGRVSLYNARPGVHLVQAIIGNARGEYATRDAAVRAFLASSDIPCPQRDLTLGRSGTVFGSMMLLEILPNSDPLWNEIRSSGQRRLNDLWAETAEFDSISSGKQWPNLGIAHGWAGLLYLTFRWHELVGTPIPPACHDRLIELMNAASPSGRGAIWPWRERPGDDYSASMPGWCNGSAGMVHLFCLAQGLLGDDWLLEVADGAAWHAWEAGAGPVDLCCGYAGRAYALLELYRATGDTNWLSRAHVLADRAVDIAPQMRGANHPRHSLYKGELGLALLLSDLEEPRGAAMPLFGSERWREGCSGIYACAANRKK